MTEATLPTEERPIRLDPELGKQVGKMLDPLSGAELEAARKAVMSVYHSGFSGNFHELVARYEEAINEAIKSG